MRWSALVLSAFLTGAPLCADAEEPPRSRPVAFPAELTEFRSVPENPVFTAAGEGHWDAAIRERGWILKENGRYRLWYTGYDGTRAGLKKLGYAESADGVRWTRHPEPLDDAHWIEDMMVLRHQGQYLMFAEGRNDQAHLLTSGDGIEWRRVGRLDVRLTSGEPIPPGPYGTPTAHFENGTWYLFYERGDRGVWLATSDNLGVFTNIQDEPVLRPGPGAYDSEMIALNQVIRRDGRYYACYHGSGTAEKPRLWCTCLATSPDLIHWEKYPGNPLLPLEENKSSGIVVPEGDAYRLYTMHGEVHLHLPAGAKETGGSSGDRNERREK